MDKTFLRRYLTVLALMGLGALLVLFGEGALTPVESGLRAALPERVGGYTAHTRWFCQAEQCQKSFLDAELTESNGCPACRAPLDILSLGERLILPADTVILKKEYLRADGDRVAVTVVFSGADQKSIHRPQQCLPAQGLTIDGVRVIEAPLAGRDPLRLMLLDIHSQGESRSPFAFAYWFVGGERETPYHLQRLFWMARDRVLHGVSRSWAYVSVMTGRREGSEEHVAVIRRFVAELWPLLSGGRDGEGEDRR